MKRVKVHSGERKTDGSVRNRKKKREEMGRKENEEDALTPSQ